MDCTFSVYTTKQFHLKVCVNFGGQPLLREEGVETDIRSISITCPFNFIFDNLVAKPSLSDKIKERIPLTPNNFVPENY